jgi:predicted acylesterase/phospholipase RssA
LRVAVTFISILAVGCAAAPPRHPLPESLASQATVSGFPAGVRHWADETPQGFRDWLELPDGALRERYGGIMDRPHDYLVISGGGENGAFGAGLLVGWTATGQRPEFTMVTGISTGAIIAPFAFLGPRYDAVLREIYTSYSAADLVRRRNVFALFGADAAFETEPFERLIEKYLGDAEIAAIAAEGRRGRSLLIGTTNIDAARPVIWDLTRIAMSGVPGSRRLICDVIRASAAIPGAFPPVRFDVQAGGQHYDELHVDGGVTSQLFLDSVGLDWRKIVERLQVTGPPTVHVIRNARLQPQWQAVRPRILPILGRTVASMVRTQGIGDIAQVYLASRQAGMAFRVARVPTDFNLTPAELFDSAYMRALFDRGVEAGRTGDAWYVPDAP